MMAATHAGMTTEEFSKTVSDWIATAKHPEFPREQVVGAAASSSLKCRRPAGACEDPAVDLISDHEGKPGGIQSHIGRRPIAAFGNSDGDLQMLQWTQRGADRVLP